MSQADVVRKSFPFLTYQEPATLPFSFRFFPSLILFMSGRILRIPILRSIIPRITPPLLPVSRLRAGTGTSALTHSPRQSHTRPFSYFTARLSSTSPENKNPEDPDHTLPPNASLSQRLKHLIKTYGWYALGMYVVLSTLDFAIAFAAINLVGAEHVSRVANAVKQVIADTIHSKPAEPGRDEIEAVAPPSSGHEGLYAMIVLAYTVHKTLFLPIRVGLTAYLTPRFVGWLRVRGWAGSAGTKRAAAQMRERINRNKGETE